MRGYSNSPEYVSEVQDWALRTDDDGYEKQEPLQRQQQNNARHSRGPPQYTNNFYRPYQQQQQPRPSEKRGTPPRSHRYAQLTVVQTAPHVSHQQHMMEQSLQTESSIATTRSPPASGSLSESIVNALSPRSTGMTARPQLSARYDDQVTQSHFRSNSQYSRHNSSVKNDGTTKAFSCTFCPYQTDVKTNYRVHIRTHTGEKPYVCTLCNYRSSQRSNLRSHMARHAAEKTREQPSQRQIH